MSAAIDEVLIAANALVEAFGAHDTNTYFAAFDVDASFVFHPETEAPLSRDRYRELWATWEADGFHVDGCISGDAKVQLITSDVAVFTHHVQTVISGSPPLYERESIVLRRSGDGRWLAVHEHLSPAPRAPATTTQDGGHA